MRIEKDLSLHFIMLKMTNWTIIECDVFLLNFDFFYPLLEPLYS